MASFEGFNFRAGKKASYYIDKKGIQSLRSIVALGNSSKVRILLFEVLNVIGSKMVENVKSKMEGELIEERSGALKKAVKYKVGRTGFNFFVRVGIFESRTSRYAGIQEKGGTIFPKNSRTLAIPTRLALDVRGARRFRSPRNFPQQLTFIRFRKKTGNVVGGLYIKSSLKNVKSLREAKLVYLLATKVRLKARRFVEKGVTELIPEANLLLNTFLSQKSLLS